MTTHEGTAWDRFLISKVLILVNDQREHPSSSMRCTAEGDEIGKAAEVGSARDILDADPVSATKMERLTAPVSYRSNLEAGGPIPTISLPRRGYKERFAWTRDLHKERQAAKHGNCSHSTVP